jgi:SAM-dependent methyltransferase
MVGILSNQRTAILEAVQAMYTDVARHPTRGFHFPTGRECCAFLGYPDALLDTVPARVIESFAGVGYPFAVGAIAPGDTVLDIGSGSGTDALIAASIAGSTGRVIGIDATPAMLEKFESSTADNTAKVELLHGDAEAIPVPDASVDVVTSNGVLNLVPNKPRAIAEIFRVLRAGGRVQIADVVLATPVSEACREDPRLWVECVVGATMEDDLVAMFRVAGFRKVEVLTRFDYFAGSSSADTRQIAAALGAQTIVLRASK